MPRDAKPPVPYNPLTGQHLPARVFACFTSEGVYAAPEFRTVGLRCDQNFTQ
jgi:hypothetical protein